MILNVSGRCDIVAYYTPWFMNRIKAGFVDVRNPFYEQQVSRIPLDKEHIDAIVFCTKNPIPMLLHLQEVPFPYLFHVTLTPYQKDIEPNVPDKKEIIEAIQSISQTIGKDRVVVRYDPVFISEKYTLAYHALLFERLCQQLSEYVSVIVISFIDMKKNTQKHAFKEMSIEEIHAIASVLGEIAKRYNVTIQTCAEHIDLTRYGISDTPCFSNEMMYHLTGTMKKYPRNTNRKVCDCIANVDIGYYNCCPHFCSYCYANYDEKKVHANHKLHNPKSTLLIGELKEDDVIKIREK